MTTAGKIRVLLTLLFASLLITAMVVENTYTPESNLTQTAGLLENNLHKKENFVYDLINNKKTFGEIKKLAATPVKATRYINDITIKKAIWFITLKDGNVNFWSGAKVVPQNAAKIKEGCSFIKQPNAYYETIKKTEGNI